MGIVQLLPLPLKGPMIRFREQAKQNQMKKRSPDTRLMNKAVHYLGRYASSRHKLAEVLGRFAQRKLLDDDPDEVKTSIANIVKHCVDLGYLDDEQFAQNQARSQRRLGRSSRVIHQRLRQHKLDQDTIDTALAIADQDTPNGDLLAAFLFARRRRLGPFDKRGPTPATHNSNDLQRHRQRQLAALARAGFSMNISQKIIGVEDNDAAEAIIAQLENGEQPFW